MQALPKLSCSSAKNRCKPRLPKPFPVQGSSNLVPNHLSTCWPHTQAQSLPLEAEDSQVPNLHVHTQSLGETEALISHFPAFFFFFLNFLGCAARLWDLPRPETEHTPLALETQILNHWTARDVPSLAILSHTGGREATQALSSPPTWSPFFCPKRNFQPLTVQRIIPVAVVIPNLGTLRPTEGHFLPHRIFGVSHRTSLL